MGERSRPVTPVGEGTRDTGEKSTDLMCGGGDP